MRVKCGNCGHQLNSGNCRFDFRMASGAAGQAVDDTRDVYWCQDYSEKKEDSWDDESDGEEDER